jgi:O-antigen/teichoic acid export membrane protein
MRNRSFIGNSALNFLGQVVVMVIAFVSIPFIVRTLGSERFGLLTLLWMFVGYFTVFDLGVGQAAVKFVSERIGSSDREGAAQVLRTVLMVSGLVGLTGAVAAFAPSFWGIDRVLNTPEELRGTANAALRVLAFGIPASLLSASMRSVPTAFGRFDIVNGLQILSGLLQWGGSLLVLAFGGGFFGVVVLTLCSRYLILAIYGGIVYRFVPEIGRKGTQSSIVPSTLLKYGGWVSVSQVAAPLLSLMERLFVGGMLSLAWVTYYSVPSDTVLRMLIIPMSLVTTLFPLMSGEWRSEEGRVRMRSLYARSLKLVVVVLFPVVIILAAFSGEILWLWLGQDFREKSSVVFSLLALGTLLNAMAQLPQATLQAIGRPDQPAKFVLVQIPIYAGLTAALTAAAGIVGTAIAWVSRVVVETVVLLFLAARAMGGLTWSFREVVWQRKTLVLLGWVPLVMCAKLLAEIPAAALSLLAAAGCLYAVLVWKYVLETDERELVRRLIAARLSGSKGNQDTFST